MTFRRAARSSAIALLVATAPRAARADDGPRPSAHDEGTATGESKEADTDPSRSAPSRIVPPKLVQPVLPTFPEAERGKNARPTVVLAILIDERGRVMESTVLESGGGAFDAAAAEAALRLVFEPAMRDGVAVAARIPFRFAFAEAIPESETAHADDLLGTRHALAGRVRTQAGEPIAKATVRVRMQEGEAQVETDALGRFRIEANEGPVEVLVVADGFAPLVVADVVGPEDASRDYELVSAEGASIEVRGGEPPREPTVRSLDRAEVRTMPGANGDPLRALEAMPGVARPPAPGGMLIVRGSGPRDTWISVDGTWLPAASHFGGVATVIPGDVLEKLEFKPGNFGPEHGRAMGGVVDMALASPRKDRIGGLAQVDLLDGRLLVQGPLGERTRFLVSGRRSWVDAWLGPVLRNAGTGVTTAPVYADAQAILEHDLSRSTKARLSVFGSDDRLALVLTSPDAKDPGFGGTFGAQSSFLRVQGRVETRVSDALRMTHMASWGTNGESFRGGDNRVETQFQLAQLRSEVRGQVTSKVATTFGLDLLYGHYDVTLILPGATALEDRAPGPLFAAQSRRLAARDHVLRPAAYTQLEIVPASGLMLLPGVRVDHSTETKQTTVDPRAAVRWDIRSGEHRTTLKGGLGLYHQPPLNEGFAPWGDPSVRHMRATHASVGIEQPIGADVDLGVEGFAKELDRLIVARPAETSTASGVSYENTGEGTVRGIEVLARVRASHRLSGVLAYTLSRSERRDAPDAPKYVFAFDQTHVLSALASFDAGRGWTLGARFRYVTGTPITPIVGGIVDLDAGAYEAVQGARLSARLPDFHRVDVRVEKVWKIRDARISAYLDVQNLTNARNPEGLLYRYDYARAERASGLPILPILGLRGEL
jgi:TonB family protein